MHARWASRWVKVGTEGYPKAKSEMYRGEEWATKYVGYRCNYVGDYAWTPRLKEQSSSWERFKTKEQIHECLRSAKVRRQRKAEGSS